MAVGFNGLLNQLKATGGYKMILVLVSWLVSYCRPFGDVAGRRYEHKNSYVVKDAIILHDTYVCLRFCIVPVRTWIFSPGHPESAHPLPLFLY